MSSCSHHPPCGFARLYHRRVEARWRQFRLQWHVLTRNILQKIALGVYCSADPGGHHCPLHRSAS